MMIADKLRKSILQAAIQGKLTEHLPTDGDARDLLEKIRAEKQRLIKEKKIKKESPLPAISDEEIPFDIPDNWCWCRLGDISEFINGDRSSSYPKANDYVKFGIPFFGASDMVNGILSFENVRFISEKKFNELRSGKLKNQDWVCLLRGSIGKTAKFEAIENIKTGFINAQMVIIRLIDNSMNNYISKILNSNYFIQFINDSYSGTAVKQLAAETLRKFLIPFPPLDEQRRIVEKVDELTTELNSLEKDEQILNQLQNDFPKRLKASLLQSAIQGKLTEQLPDDGDARDLLKSIQQEKEKLIKEKKLKPEKPLPPISDDEIPFDIPDNWCWCRLGEIFQINPRNKSIDDDVNVSFMPMNLLNNDYNNSFESNMRKWKDIKNNFTHFADNDVVFAKITPCFQNLKSAVMKNLINGIGAGTTELHVLRAYNNLMHIEYALYFVKSPIFIRDGLSNLKGTAGQQRVSSDFIKHYLFPLPPLAEQKRIVSQLKKLLSLCDLFSM